MVTKSFMPVRDTLVDSFTTEGKSLILLLDRQLTLILNDYMKKDI